MTNEIAQYLKPGKKVSFRKICANRNPLVIEAKTKADYTERLKNNSGEELYSANLS